MVGITILYDKILSKLVYLPSLALDCPTMVATLSLQSAPSGVARSVSGGLGAPYHLLILVPAMLPLASPVISVDFSGESPFLLGADLLCPLMQYSSSTFDLSVFVVIKYILFMLRDSLDAKIREMKILGNFKKEKVFIYFTPWGGGIGPGCPLLTFTIVLLSHKLVYLNS